MICCVFLVLFCVVWFCSDLFLLLSSILVGLNTSWCLLARFVVYRYILFVLCAFAWFLCKLVLLGAPRRSPGVARCILVCFWCVLCFLMHFCFGGAYFDLFWLFLFFWSAFLFFWNICVFLEHFGFGGRIIVCFWAFYSFFLCVVSCFEYFGVCVAFSEISWVRNFSPRDLREIKKRGPL